MGWFQKTGGGRKPSIWLSSAPKRCLLTGLLPRQLRRQIKTLFHRMQGYRFGVIWCAVVTGAACLINLIFTAWASAHYQISNGSVTLHDGDCAGAKTLDMWLHIAINGLSTVALGASNYTMQCLSAPTREEVDKAHREKTWLDIGIPSLRNLLRVSRVRSILWIIIAISSLPLNLIYNSAIFTTMSANEYSVYTVSQDFLQGVPFTVNLDNLILYNGVSGMYKEHDENKKYLSGGLSSLGTFISLDSIRTLDSIRQGHVSVDILDNKACINAYSTDFLSTRGSVLLVITESNVTNPVLNWSAPWQLRRNLNEIDLLTSQMDKEDARKVDVPYSWICFNAPIASGHYYRSTTFHYQMLYQTTPCDKKTHDPWGHLGYQVDHCISQRRQQHCQVQFSIYIMILVVFCNLAKSSIMIYLAWSKRVAPLITSGDAVSSFLDQPDHTTAGACMMDQTQFGLKNWDMTPRTWPRQRYFWFQALGVWPAVLSNLLFLILLYILGMMLWLGLKNGALSSNSISHLWTLGFGAVTPESIIKLPTQVDSLIGTTLLSNSPQVLLSLSYILYNRLFTRMLQADEWSKYAQERQALRVSSPKGQQLSTYWLQLPYVYSIPLLISQFVLHWLVSQSIFLARVVLYNENDQPMDKLSISTCGYSEIAIIFTLIFGSMVVLCVLVNLLRQFKAGMPLVGSCSAAISAACHPPTTDVKASEKLVQWGALLEGRFNREGQFVGHCCFTSFPVRAPKENVLYAGLSPASELPAHGDGGP